MTWSGEKSPQMMDRHHLIFGLHMRLRAMPKGPASGVGALGLAIWSLRKPQQDRGVGLIVGLTIITAAIVVQGWFGGALVHGMDHMNW